MKRLALVTFNQPPKVQASLKYADFADAAATRLRRYARRQGLPLLEQVPDLRGAAPCWGKLTALLGALEAFDCALWVDADALVHEDAPPLAALLDLEGDIIAQEPSPWFARTRLSPARGWDMQPVNTGVFAVRRSGADLLRASLAKAVPLAPGKEWNGLGDQEGLAEVIRAQGAAARVGYFEALQLPPGSGETALFTHHYGDRAAYRYPAQLCRAVVRGLAARSGLSATQEGLLHWCAIQRLEPAEANRGGPERFGYQSAMLDEAMKDWLRGGAVQH